MKIHIIKCDNCGKLQENDIYHQFRLFKERRSNHVEYENYDWVSDLCPACTSKMVTRLTKVLAALPNDQLKAEIVKEFKCREE